MLQRSNDVSAETSVANPSPKLSLADRHLEWFLFSVSCATTSRFSERAHFGTKLGTPKPRCFCARSGERRPRLFRDRRPHPRRDWIDRRSIDLFVVVVGDPDGTALRLQLWHHHT